MQAIRFDNTACASSNQNVVTTTALIQMNDVSAVAHAFKTHNAARAKIAHGDASRSSLTYSTAAHGSQRHRRCVVCVRILRTRNDWCRRSAESARQSQNAHAYKSTRRSAQLTGYNTVINLICRSITSCFFASSKPKPMAKR